MGAKTVEEFVEDLSTDSNKTLYSQAFYMEARVGIEPTMQLLQSRALPLGYPATGDKEVKFVSQPNQVKFRSRPLV